MKRKIIQLVYGTIQYDTNDVTESLFALCNDGTVWTKTNSETWKQMDEIPQPEKKKAKKRK